MEITVKTNSKDVERGFRRLMRVGADLRPVLGQVGLHVRRSAQRRLRARQSEFGPSKGRLSKSLTMRVAARLVSVGSPLVYAAIQQLGGEVKPRRKYLAIPLTAQLRQRGVWPRDFPADALKYTVTSIVLGRRQWTGPALVGEDGEPLFALVRSVNIRGRPYLMFDHENQVFAVRALRTHYMRAMKGGAKK